MEKQIELGQQIFLTKKAFRRFEYRGFARSCKTKTGTTKTLDFIKNSQNVILAGNPGTGKTHIAIGLGIKACLEGYKSAFLQQFLSL